jgi:hypothetical protein
MATVWQGKALEQGMSGDVHWTEAAVTAEDFRTAVGRSPVASNAISEGS